MERIRYHNQIEQAFKVTPVVALLGPRQCGKTTLARSYIKKLPNFASANYFDLEDPDDLERLRTNPKTSLTLLSGLVVIDEIQRIPELFPLLRVLVDAQETSAQFLILGSASKDLIRQSSETLAGRITYLEITPFTRGETLEGKSLWIRGGFPRSYLADSDELSWLWRKGYVSTFLERDIPALGIQIPSPQLRRFWTMLTHCHGTVFNASDLGNSLGISHTTVRRYLDILTGTFMVRTLQPWHENLSKRQVKQPKVFFRDSGLFHYLLGVSNQDALLTHPKLGASWEGFALEQIIACEQAAAEDCYFWAVHAQAELDLLIVRGGEKRGYEIKFSETPSITKSIQMAIDLLKVDSLTIVTSGSKSYPLSDKVSVCGLETLVALRSNQNPG